MLTRGSVAWRLMRCRLKTKLDRRPPVRRMMLRHDGLDRDQTLRFHTNSFPKAWRRWDAIDTVLSFDGGLAGGPRWLLGVRSEQYRNSGWPCAGCEY